MRRTTKATNNSQTEMTRMTRAIRKKAHHSSSTSVVLCYSFPFLLDNASYFPSLVNSLLFTWDYTLLLLEANLKRPLRDKRTAIKTADSIVGFLLGRHVDETESLA